MGEVQRGRLWPVLDRASKGQSRLLGVLQALLSPCRYSSAYYWLCYNGFLSAGSLFYALSRAHWILPFSAAGRLRTVDGYILYLTAMGNIGGCVRGPKEESYVDPKNAPLNPESRELKGRRYFQKKKRKSEDLKTFGSLKSPGSEVVTSKAIYNTAELQDESGEKSEPNQAEDDLSRQGSISKGVYVEEVTVVLHTDAGNELLRKNPANRLESLSTDREDKDSSGTTVERKLHGICTTSGRTSSRDSLLVKKLLQRQLRRAVSFGAVEHMLQTLKGNDRSGSEETFAKIICGSQAHRRRRRRSFSCSGYTEQSPAPAKRVSTQHQVKQQCATSSNHGGDSRSNETKRNYMTLKSDWRAVFST